MGSRARHIPGGFSEEVTLGRRLRPVKEPVRSVGRNRGARRWPFGESLWEGAREGGRDQGRAELGLRCKRRSSKQMPLLDP